MSNATPEEKIIDYLDGDLSETERASFEKTLAEDPALAEQLRRFRQARQGVMLQGIRNEVSKARKEMLNEQETGKIVPLNRRSLIRSALAIAATLLVAVIGIQLYQNANPSLDDLYNQKYRAYQVETTRGAVDSSNQEIKDAFSQHQYAQVVALAASVKTPQASLLLAISYLELNEAPKAIPILDSVLRQGRTGNQIREEADYYSVLAHIRAHDVPGAISIIHSINDQPQHSYKGYFDESYVRSLQRAK